MKSEILPIPGFSDYFASNSGDIYSEKKGIRRKMKPNLNKRHRRYQIILMDDNGIRKTIKIHVLVAITFLGPRPKGLQIAHLDNNRLNNSASNLKYCTSKENDSHKDIFGTRTITKGDLNGNSKITKDAAIFIRSAFVNKELSAVRLGKIFGVSTTQIYRIVDKTRWSSL